MYGLKQDILLGETINLNFVLGIICVGIVEAESSVGIKCPIVFSSIRYHSLFNGKFFC